MNTGPETNLIKREYGVSHAGECLDRRPRKPRVPRRGRGRMRSHHDRYLAWRLGVRHVQVAFEIVADSDSDWSHALSVHRTLVQSCKPAIIGHGPSLERVADRERNSRRAVAENPQHP